MRNRTYNLAFKQLRDGFTDLGFCLAVSAAKGIRYTVRSTNRAVCDYGKTAIAHPVLTLIIVVCFYAMIITVAAARAERDNLSREMYSVKMRNQSLENIINHPHK